MRKVYINTTTDMVHTMRVSEDNLRKLFRLPVRKGEIVSAELNGKTLVVKFSDLKWQNNIIKV